MHIAPEILGEYPTINAQQRAIVMHEQGPLLVVAGPGSGKTMSIILRAMNLLLLKKAQPSELVLCTYTEKAAHEMRDRIATLAAKIQYKEDLSQLKVSTIHGLCNQLIMEYRHRTPLGNGYETLDQFSQWLFLFQHLAEICSPEALTVFMNRWGTKWDVAKRLQSYFDKIMEELIKVNTLMAGKNVFCYHLAQSYCIYRNILIRENCASFAALQKIAYNLLMAPDTSLKITQGIRYVFLDEYQDTNYIQEQIVLRLTATGNICVVGDEDQALYRFRGATVRNILEFPNRIPQHTTIQLTTNYRSHAKIVRAYDQWMASADWSNAAGLPFRTEKTIEPNGSVAHPDYPAIFSIYGRDALDEAEQFAGCISFLMQERLISDYSQVALLLHSVRPSYSNPYIEALKKKAIPIYCPRARSYFEQQEVCLMVACFAEIFGYRSEKRDDILDDDYFCNYIKSSLQQLHADYDLSHPLRILLDTLALEVLYPDEGQEQVLDIQPADYFYRLFAVEPFATFIKDERQMRNLVIFSKVLRAFQSSYRFTSIASCNREHVCSHFFTIFLRLLQDHGLNEYEDIEQSFPMGHVQIMTIHQAKGLEFPVVAVGGLDIKYMGAEEVDRDLQSFYQRLPFEPEKRIPRFDLMRLYYVGFSRAERLLILTSHKQPRADFDTIWQGLPRWPSVQSDLLAVAQIPSKVLVPSKRRYSFTSHISMYETCPRQYQYFREYEFVPSLLRQKDVLLGLLVHQTLEELHRRVLDGKFATLDEFELRKLFERIYACLSRTHPRPIDPYTKEQAFIQVLNYFTQNRRELQSIIGTEVSIEIEKDGYMLSGRIDLLLERDGKLELLDFKTARRPPDTAALLLDYERQLCTYAYALERRYGKRPARLLLYWTEEPRREDALMEFRYQPAMVEQVSAYIDGVISKIKRKDFNVITPPEPHVCSSCDMQHMCISEGTITPLPRNCVTKLSGAQKVYIPLVLHS